MRSSTRWRPRAALLLGVGRVCTQTNAIAGSIRLVAAAPATTASIPTPASTTIGMPLLAFASIRLAARHHFMPFQHPETTR